MITGPPLHQPYVTPDAVLPIYTRRAPMQISVPHTEANVWTCLEDGCGTLTSKIREPGRLARATSVGQGTATRSPDTCSRRSEPQRAVKYGSQGLVKSGVMVAASAAASDKDHSGLTRRRSDLDGSMMRLDSMRPDEEQIRSVI